MVVKGRRLLCCWPIQRLSAPPPPTSGDALPGVKNELKLVLKRTNAGRRRAQIGKSNEPHVNNFLKNLELSYTYLYIWMSLFYDEKKIQIFNLNGGNHECSTERWAQNFIVNYSEQPLLKTTYSKAVHIIPV